MRDGNVGRRHGKPRGIGILARADGVEPTGANVAAWGKFAFESRKHLGGRRALPIKKHQLRRKQCFVIRHTVLQSCMRATMLNMIAKRGMQGQPRIPMSSSARAGVKHTSGIVSNMRRSLVTT